MGFPQKDQDVLVVVVGDGVLESSKQGSRETGFLVVSVVPYL